MCEKCEKSNEVKSNEVKSNEEEVLEEKGFINEYNDEFLEYVDKWKRRSLYKQKEYKKLEEQERKIKEKYPNIQKFLEEKEIIELKKEELEGLLDILDIREEKDIFEQKLCFKLGIVEEKVLLSEFNYKEEN